MTFYDDKAYAINALIAAVTAIENELGIVPAGAYATVRARLDILEARINQGAPPTGAAGGDLSGTYPDPIVATSNGNTIITAATTAAGDLSGNFPAPEVSGLLSHALPSLSTGFLNWTGTAWAFSPGGGGGGGSPTGPAGGDLGGTYPNPEVVKLYTYPIANTAPIQSAVPVWDVSAAKYDIRQLTMDDIGAGFSITGFAGGFTVEIGDSVVNPTFTASYSSTPISANITNSDNIDSPLNLVNPFTSGTVVGTFTHNSLTYVLFTLQAVGSSTQSAGQYIEFFPRSFGGVGSPGATSATASGFGAILSTSDVVSNLGLFASDVGNSYGPFNPSSQKIYLLMPHTATPHTFTSGPFSFPFNAPTTFNFTNDNGVVLSYDLYESTNTLSAPFTIVVAS